MGFPCLGGKFWRFWGPETPKMWISATFPPKRLVYQRNHVVWCIIHGGRKFRLTCGLVRGKKGENKVTKVWQTAIAWGRHRSKDPQNFFADRMYSPTWSPLPNLVLIGWRVFVPQGVEIRLFPILSRTAHTTVLCTNVQRCDKHGAISLTILL